jgi:formylglycine-generating enzyme required for sulfatase activity
LAADGYRVPLEAEWCRACQAGRATSRFFGTASTIAGQNYVADSATGELLVGGTVMPNQTGLFDLFGNVQEFTLDWIDEDRRRANPVLQGIPGNARLIVKGGNLRTPFTEYGLEKSIVHMADQPSGMIGFRLVRTMSNRGAAQNSYPRAEGSME